MTERIRNRLREDSITLQRLTWKKRIEFIWMVTTQHFPL